MSSKHKDSILKSEVSLKSLSFYRDSPVVKGNALLALTGLAVTVSKYESSLPSETEGAPEVRVCVSMFLFILFVLSVLLVTLSCCFQGRRY